MFDWSALNAGGISQCESREMQWDVQMSSTITSLSFYSVLVSILCLCQDVIAEDAREGLPSCPSDPTMVTCSCGALRICLHMQPVLHNLHVCKPHLSFLVLDVKMHDYMFDRLLVLLLWSTQGERIHLDGWTRCRKLTLDTVSFATLTTRYQEVFFFFVTIFSICKYNMHEVHSDVGAVAVPVLL